MNKQELQRAKDISIAFQWWLQENCVDYIPGKSYYLKQGYEDELLSWEQLFDIFVHDQLVEIELEKKLG